MFDHDCKRINETVRAAGGVLQALLAALDAESKTSVLDDMMCLVNYSFKRYGQPLQPTKGVHPGLVKH